LIGVCGKIDVKKNGSCNSISQGRYNIRSDIDVQDLARDCYSVRTFDSLVVTLAEVESCLEIESLVTSISAVGPFLLARTMFLPGVIRIVVTVHAEYPSRSETANTISIEGFHVVRAINDRVVAG
jgi:hypothetical protein